MRVHVSRPVDGVGRACACVGSVWGVTRHCEINLMKSGRATRTPKNAVEPAARPQMRCTQTHGAHIHLSSFLCAHADLPSEVRGPARARTPCATLTLCTTEPPMSAAAPDVPEDAPAAYTLGELLDAHIAADPDTPPLDRHVVCAAFDAWLADRYGMVKMPGGHPAAPFAASQQWLTVNFFPETSLDVIGVIPTCSCSRPQALTLYDAPTWHDFESTTCTAAPLVLTRAEAVRVDAAADLVECLHTFAPRSGDEARLRKDLRTHTLQRTLRAVARVPYDRSELLAANLMALQMVVGETRTRAMLAHAVRTLNDEGGGLEILLAMSVVARCPWHLVDLRSATFWAMALARAPHNILLSLRKGGFLTGKGMGIIERFSRSYELVVYKLAGMEAGMEAAAGGRGAKRPRTDV